jgi:hypothetical protein
LQKWLVAVVGVVALFFGVYGFVVAGAAERNTFGRISNLGVRQITFCISWSACRRCTPRSLTNSSLRAACRCQSGV